MSQVSMTYSEVGVFKDDNALSVVILEFLKHMEQNQLPF